MLISKTTKIRWNPKTCKHYINLGYQFTKIGDEFDVCVNDLTNGSQAIVVYQCDYCHQQKEIAWKIYCYKRIKNNLANDCCKDCLQLKAKEALYDKFGTYNIRDIPEVNEKIKQTNINKYGCDNPFGNKDVQNKIKEFYQTNYGVSHNMQIPKCVEKSEQTQLERYGVKHFGALWSKQHPGELSPSWIGDKVKNERTERETPSYREWRKSVFERDLYTCQKCGCRNGNGTYIRLEAHHIFNWAKYPNMRYEITNGITLCSNCHSIFHSIFGKKDNTNKQLEEFLK